MEVLWPFVLYVFSVIAVAALLLIAAHVSGERHRERATGRPYESGIAPAGAPGNPIDIRYYVVAILFVIFDLEAVFYIAWSISVRESGWQGFLEILVFTIILAAALLYILRMGALNWGREGK
ncbi:MAG: NADH-quinone oxidoreductase subunit A [Syntrophaceae bacterium]